MTKSCTPESRRTSYKVSCELRGAENFGRAAVSPTAPLPAWSQANIGRNYGPAGRDGFRGRAVAGPKTGVITVATSKYGRKYGWQHRADGREFRGTWPRYSSDQNLISWLRHEIRRFDDHNTEAPHSALDTGRARRIKFRGRATKFRSSRPRKFRGAQILPRNSRVFLTPYLQPYSEVASGYSPGNCASVTRRLGVGRCGIRSLPAARQRRAARRAVIRARH